MPTKTTSDGAAAPPKRRQDASRNRDRILRAAYEVFAESGVDAQMVDIAEAAGVGVATVYRNFATKEDLINALLLDYFDRVIEVAQQAVEETDAWEALVKFFQWVTTLQLENRALSEFLAGRIGGTRELWEHRHQFYELLEAVAVRAQDQGQLRRDVNVSDLRALFVALARLASGESPLMQRLVRRVCGVMLDGLRDPGSISLEGPPLSTSELDKLLARGDGPPARAFRRGRRAWPTGG